MDTSIVSIDSGSLEDEFKGFVMQGEDECDWSSPEVRLISDPTEIGTHSHCDSL